MGSGVLTKGCKAGDACEKVWGYVAAIRSAGAALVGETLKRMKYQVWGGIVSIARAKSTKNMFTYLVYPKTAARATASFVRFGR